MLLTMNRGSRSRLGSFPGQVAFSFDISISRTASAYGLDSGSYDPYDVLDSSGLAAVELLIRATCAGIFLWAGWAKFNDRRFASAVRRLTGLSEDFSAFVALALPRVELLVGLGLLLTPTAQVAAAVGFMALAVFTVILLRQIASPVSESCACFGTADTKPVSWFTVGRNVAMALALVPAAVRPPIIEAQLVDGLPWDVQALVILGAMLSVGLSWTVGSLRTMRASELESQ